MLIAAAIKTHIKATDKDVIIQCRRHYEAYRLLKDMGFQPGGYIVSETGFVTHKGEFLDRHAAWEYAAEIGQISQQQIHDTNFSKILLSEDLW